MKGNKKKAKQAFAAAKQLKANGLNDKMISGLVGYHHTTVNKWNKFDKYKDYCTAQKELVAKNKATRKCAPKMESLPENMVENFVKNYARQTELLEQINDSLKEMKKQPKKWF